MTEPALLPPSSPDTFTLPKTADDSLSTKAKAFSIEALLASNSSGINISCDASDGSEGSDIEVCDIRYALLVNALYILGYTQFISPALW